MSNKGFFDASFYGTGSVNAKRHLTIHPNPWDGVQLSDLVARMKHPKTGLVVKDRKWRFKSYKNCFVGK
jgi:hypothetical protein